MKNFLVLFTLVLFAVSLNSVFAQEEGEGMNEEMMKAWQESMTPGPMHEMLAHKVGEWKAEVSTWMDPSQPPSVSEATTVCESFFGGRYFKSSHTGDMMGMPFEGFELSGYDNIKKKFFSVWMDNMGTGIMTTEGTYDEATKTITLTGSMMDPMGNDMKIRELVKVIDNDNTMFEMYMEVSGKPEMKWMEIKYTRVK